MNIEGIVLAFFSGATLVVISTGIIHLFRQITTGETNFVLPTAAEPTTTDPQSAICPRCGSPIDAEHHPTRHYETTSPPVFKWSETYCGNPPHLNSRTPSR